MSLDEMIRTWHEESNDQCLRDATLSKHAYEDIDAFLVLSDFGVPATLSGEIVACAEHDKIWLNVDCGKLANVITEAHIRHLVACGVGYDDETESLYMFR